MKYEYERSPEFTETEIAALKMNPWVKNVTSQKIYYTREFHEKAIQDMMSGKSIRTILNECALPIDILGRKRIESLASNLRTRIRNWKDLHSEDEKIQRKNRQLSQADENIQRLKKELKMKKEECRLLLHQRNYYEAENSFLKKNIFLTGALYQPRKSIRSSIS